MKKLLLLIVLAGVAWWYFDYSHRMTEAQIREAYAADVDAWRRFDADALCARIAEDYSFEQTLHEAGKTRQLHLDKSSVCQYIRQSVEAMQRLSTSTHGRFTLDIQYEIKSIELSVNRKEATVESSSTIRLGDMTVAREHSTDHLIRRNLRILSTSGESQSWSYTPQ